MEVPPGKSEKSAGTGEMGPPRQKNDLSKAARAAHETMKGEGGRLLRLASVASDPSCLSDAERRWQETEEA
jgi:hypothetical protein